MAVGDFYKASQGVGTVIHQSDSAEIKQSADFAVDAANAAVTLTVPDSFTEKFRVYDYKGSFEINSCTVDFSNFNQGLVSMRHNFDDIEFFYIEGDGWYLNDIKGQVRVRF